MALFLPKNHGLLGINKRNLQYLRPYNPSRAVAFADDKLKTKLFLEARGIPVPQLYAKIVDRDELRAFDFSVLPDQCVLKPNAGYGGEGILVLSREGRNWQTAEKKLMTESDVREHVEDILEGMYSLHHRRDTAFFEQLLLPHACFAPLQPAGLPDIRIVVFNLVPVMAMIRIPTRESQGKANLHLGGIGLGVDLAKGVTTFAVQRNQCIYLLPHGQNPAGFKIPSWDEMLLIAARIQHITNIGFLGVDLTLDAESGPLLLEVNARAGLMVQIANLSPLGRRLERVEGLTISSPEKGVRIAQDLFGEKVALEDMEQGKPVLGLRETVEVLGGKKSVFVPAILRPNHERTIFDPTLLRELQILDAVERLEGDSYRVKFQLGGRKIQTVVTSCPIEEEGVRVSVGQRDLLDFLVDPSRKSAPSPLRRSIDLRRIDRQLADIDRKVQLLKYIRPTNLEEERRRLEGDISANPHFTYADLEFDAGDFLDRLQYLEGDDSPLGVLLTKKRDELKVKIRLLEVRGDPAAFTERSAVLFGAAEPLLLEHARAALQNWKRPRRKPQPSLLGAGEVQEMLQSTLFSYGLRDWRVIQKSAAVADCSLGRHVIILREGARFSEERIQSLIAHEIETHVLTAENAERQPWEILGRFAGYLETQEGLAMVNQERVLPSDHEKRFWSAMGVLAVHYALTHSFAELRSYIRRFGFDDARALRTTLKVKRGLGDTGRPGAFLRETVYFRGYLLVKEFLEKGGDLRELYKGKINLRDLSLVRKVPGLVEPLYLPQYLTEKKPPS